MNIKTPQLCLALLTVATLSSPCFAGPIVNFQYNFTAPSELTGYKNISASGTLTTDGAVSVAGSFEIIGITGTRTVDGVTSAITGLVPPGGYGGNTNLLLFPGPPFLTLDGFTFTISDATASDDLLGNVNVYIDSFGIYTEFASFSFGGDFQATEVVAETALAPEPSSGVLLLLAVGGAFAWGQRKRTKRQY